VTPSGDLRWFIGVDPGESTGVYALRVSDSPVILGVQGRWQLPPQQAVAEVEKLVRQAALWQENVLLVGERFTVTDQTGKRSAQPTPLKVLGQVEQLAYQYTNVEFILQAPADAKKFAPNPRLRELRLYTRPEDVSSPDANDVNDAARHVLLMLARRRASVYDRYLQLLDRERTQSQR
jgi:hypothetical protein